LFLFFFIFDRHGKWRSALQPSYQHRMVGAHVSGLSDTM
jgi:hypothetical protein